MDSFILGLRVLVALGAVLGFIWLVQKRLGKGKGRRRADAALTVVSRQVIGQKASVVVIDAGDKRFLLGVTEQAVTVLHSSDAPVVAPEAVDAGAPQSAGSFAELFRQASGQASVPLPAVEPVTGSLPVLRRRSELHRGQVQEHPMHGSILSASTWRQASDAIRGRRT
ncbi:flagellar biosynthetic protein FliO [Paenarthrobacter ilicis]|uniref:Flagellar protein n=1 Tax=Paenarthrobacter ilicis TaxID=43665 RepID=A0ABX0TDJ4_9MICC|nr:flagellar biosynthetic protein FliO [Paenarthrobacter ilicis]MBM7792263.1 flagellar protein FliO/FliZ [Paenarthrobacter ilicis]NIJ00607.1 flagellar protein FliO/FliZ [Paenarthrobacter ilicis]